MADGQMPNWGQRRQLGSLQAAVMGRPGGRVELSSGTGLQPWTQLAEPWMEGRRPARRWHRVS